MGGHQERAGPYARWERERRHLLRAVPAGLERGRRIEDSYLDGTRLRLRHVVDESGASTWKLGQKMRPDERDPSELHHTTMYLEQAEHALLVALPGHDLVKVRRRWQLDGATWAVDELLGRHRGIVLAELDTGAVVEPHDVVTPPGSLCDVTSDDRFTGGALARASAAELAALRRESRQGWEG